MIANAESRGNQPLSGEYLFVSGRLPGLTRRRLEHLVRVAGGKLASKPNKSITLIALCHSAAGAVQAGGRIPLPMSLPDSAPLISEDTLRRRLGLLPAPEAVDRSHAEADLARVSGLSAAVLAC